jgi:hypothetical protein
VGKAKAMDLCLTARMMDAAEAEKSGLVARVIPADQLLEETLKAATTIAGFSLPVVMMIKESVNRAYESSLNEGLLFERRVFHSPAFALEDQKEGMAAFVEKRKAEFKNHHQRHAAEAEHQARPLPAAHPLAHHRGAEEGRQQGLDADDQRHHPAGMPPWMARNTPDR